ncbi:hypothetical protein CEXT_4481 [Caerostris extrusa]|uniref:Uncharacterized protein n=1 Tax=Caerostris extrusa TaxID=172846 RepID=A0AAV4N0Y7_CAEEX|nr:hypothetical protein CEXT_4481 [Caerostris extrusa]
MAVVRRAKNTSLETEGYEISWSDVFDSAVRCMLCRRTFQYIVCGRIVYYSLCDQKFTFSLTFELTIPLPINQLIRDITRAAPLSTHIIKDNSTKSVKSNGRICICRQQTTTNTAGGCRGHSTGQHIRTSDADDTSSCRDFHCPMGLINAIGFATTLSERSQFHSNDKHAGIIIKELLVVQRRIEWIELGEIEDILLSGVNSYLKNKVKVSIS